MMIMTNRTHLVKPVGDETTPVMTILDDQTCDKNKVLSVALGEGQNHLAFLETLILNILRSQPVLWSNRN